MTTIASQTNTCFVCGNTNEYPEILSSNEFGSPDLDTRPPEMMRSTIHVWVHCCPSCGYCAAEISEGSQFVKEIVKSEKYQQQLDNQAYPPLANHFLCQAMISESAQNYRAAGWAALHAAWVCDDKNAQEASRLCRLKAIQLVQEAKDNGELFVGKQIGAQEALMADLLRRSGQFALAASVCQDGLKQNPGALVQKILNFQIELSIQQNDKCYTLADCV